MPHGTLLTKTQASFLLSQCDTRTNPFRVVTLMALEGSEGNSNSGTSEIVEASTRIAFSPEDEVWIRLAIKNTRLLHNYVEALASASPQLFLFAGMYAQCIREVKKIASPTEALHFTLALLHGPSEFLWRTKFPPLDLEQELIRWMADASAEGIDTHAHVLFLQNPSKGVGSVCAMAPLAIPILLGALSDDGMWHRGSITDNLLLAAIAESPSSVVPVSVAASLQMGDVARAANILCQGEHYELIRRFLCHSPHHPPLFSRYCLHEITTLLTRGEVERAVEAMVGMEFIYDKGFDRIVGIAFEACREKGLGRSAQVIHAWGKRAGVSVDILTKYEGFL